MRDNNAVFTGFCILIILTVSIAACTTTDSGTYHPLNPDISSSPGNQQSSEPVRITVNSAEKLQKQNNINLLAGKIFLVLNITVKNKDIMIGRMDFIFMRDRLPCAIL
jgi:hypothetical protein